MTKEKRNIFVGSGISLTVFTCGYILLASVIATVDRRAGDLAWLGREVRSLRKILDVNVSAPLNRAEVSIERVLLSRLKGFGVSDSTGLARVVLKESALQDYDPLLVWAVIKKESGFNRFAVSPKGAVGLMQLMPDTAQFIARSSGIKWLGRASLFDSAYNVKLGIAYLKYLEQGFEGKIKLALMAYNWGPGNLKGALDAKRAPYRSVEAYADRVLGTYKDLQSEII